MDSKEHIQNIAVKLFSEKGFDGTSVRQIAQEAGVNVAMISYYFKSKEGLLEEVLDGLISYHLSFFEKLEKKDELPFEKLLKIINFNIDFIIDNYQLNKVLVLETKLSKRKKIEEKAKNFLLYLYNYLKTLILKHNKEMSVYKAELLPLMIHNTIVELALSPSTINVFSKGRISNLSSFESRNEVKEKLKEFMTETLTKMIN